MMGRPDHEDLLAVDQALVVLIGGEEQMARMAAVAAVEAWPGHGALTAGAVAAARWGVDLLPALQRLADGERPRGSVSDYEWRFGSEEAADELEEALDGVAERIAGRGESGSVVLPVGHPEVHAALAAVRGIGRWELPLGLERRARMRCAVLAGVLGATATPSIKVPVAVRLDPVGVASTYVGFAVIQGSAR